MSLVSCVAVVVSWQPLADPPKAPLRIRAQTALSEKFRKVAVKAGDLSRAGEYGKFKTLLLGLVPEKDRRAEHDHFFGNLFFPLEKKLAYEFHKRAFKAEPADPDAALEWGMVQHRNGEYKGAIKAYELLASKRPNSFVPRVLLADCLIRTGKSKQAIEQWNKANHRRNRVRIDFLIHAIYGDVRPFVRHFRLMEAIRGGDKSKIEDVIRLDLDWNRDWWNTRINKELLKTDVARFKKLLGAEDPRVVAFELLAKRALGDVRGEEFGKLLKDRNLLLGENAKLPGNTEIARKLMGYAIDDKLSTRAEMRKRFEHDLRERAFGKNSNDAAAVDVLGALLIGDSAEKKLAELNRKGWKKYKVSKYCGNVLGIASKAKKLKTDSAELLQALKDFPEDSRIARLALLAARDDYKPLAPYLIRCIKAEFRTLSVNRGFIPDSYFLAAAFTLLEKELAPPKAPK